LFVSMLTIQDTYDGKESGDLFALCDMVMQWRPLSWAEETGPIKAAITRSPNLLLPFRCFSMLFRQPNNNFFNVFNIEQQLPIQESILPHHRGRSVRPISVSWGS